MKQIIVKGGYGEHGRSCFLAPFGDDRYYMMDCGILDTDPNPYPDVERSILEKTDYLFLSHCHKDHSGAFSRLREGGFRGWLVAAPPTLELAGIRYDKVISADPSAWQAVTLDGNGELHFTCGRSGHCAGGLWFKIWDSSMSCFYSGDYQRRPLAYAVDEIRDQTAELAILDCAHPDTPYHADALRSGLAERIRIGVKEHGRMILPLPRYGRGLELIVLLDRMMPEMRIAADRESVQTAKLLLSYEKWLQPQAVTVIERFLESSPCEKLEKERYDILLLADAHLEREDSRELVRRNTKQGALVVVTGRVKENGFVQEMLDANRAIRCSYPHHQSMGDFMETMGKNSFRTVLPFHNGKREMYFS